MYGLAVHSWGNEWFRSPRHSGYDPSVLVGLTSAPWCGKGSAPGCARFVPCDAHSTRLITWRPKLPSGRRLLTDVKRATYHQKLKLPCWGQHPVMPNPMGQAYPTRQTTLQIPTTHHCHPPSLAGPLLVEANRKVVHQNHTTLNRAT